MMTTAHNAIMALHRLRIGLSFFGDTARYLVDHGYCERKPDHEYVLTPKGEEYARKNEAWLGLGKKEPRNV